MATNSFQSLPHRHTLRRRHSIDCCPPSSLSTSSPFLKPTTTTIQSLSTTTNMTFSSTTSTSPTTPSTTSQPLISFDVLQQHLSSKNFRQADEETQRLLIVLAGEQAQKRGYVFFSEIQFIAEADLKAIDDLWGQHDNNRFGYSIQKKIWNKDSKDFTRFFLKVGWTKMLDTEVEQFNYRSFSTEFIWELNEETPEGHLPLTNAPRGTQLLNSILRHPAFEGDEQEEEGIGTEAAHEEKASGDNNSKGSSKLLLNKRVFRPDYSF